MNINTKTNIKITVYILLFMCFLLSSSLIMGTIIYNAICLGAYNRFCIGNAVVLGIIYISFGFLFITEVFGK